MEANRNFYLLKNDALEGYDIMKRKSILIDGKTADEKVATVYSTEYIDDIITSLNLTDSGSVG